MGEPSHSQHYFSLLGKTSTVEKLRLAIWGLGNHARRNLVAAARMSPSISLAGVHSRNVAVREECAALAECRSYATQEAMLEDAGVDVIWIATPNGVHFEQVMASLEVGKHVLVEKTAFPTVAQAKEIVSLARSRDLLVMEAFMYRFHSQFRILQELISGREFGNPVEIRATFGFPHLDHNNTRYDRDLAGGALNDAGAYTVSAIRQLASGALQTLLGNINESSRFGVDTSGAAHFIDSAGMNAYASWRFGAAYINELRIWCEEAHIVADRIFSKPESLQTEISVIANGKVLRTDIVLPENHFVSMLEKFAHDIRSGDFFSESEELLVQAATMQSVRAGTAA